MKMRFACLAVLVALVTGCNAPVGGNGASSSVQSHANGGSSPNAPAGAVGGNGSGGTAGVGGGGVSAGPGVVGGMGGGR